MAKISPNDPCPCGSEFKFKKCCRAIIDGEPAASPDALLRARHAALINNEVNFLWNSLHTDSPRKKFDTLENFTSEFRALKNIEYKQFKIADEKNPKADEYRAVIWVEAQDGDQDVSYLEESTYKKVNGEWFYFDGLRKASRRLGCMPESVKVGELNSLGLHESDLN